MDSRDNCWGVLHQPVRALLHVVHLHVARRRRVPHRCRKFPALTNCTAIDWFHAWPREALISVASASSRTSRWRARRRGARERRATTWRSCTSRSASMARQYLAQERREVYTTPKSFLELIALYKKLLVETDRDHACSMKVRLEEGLVKLRSSAAQVADMQVQLKESRWSSSSRRRRRPTSCSSSGRARSRAVADEQAAKAPIEEEKVAEIAEGGVGLPGACQPPTSPPPSPRSRRRRRRWNNLDKAALGELKGLANAAGGGARRDVRR